MAHAFENPLWTARYQMHELSSAVAAEIESSDESSPALLRRPSLLITSMVSDAEHPDLRPPQSALHDRRSPVAGAEAALVSNGSPGTFRKFFRVRPSRPTKCSNKDCRAKVKRNCGMCGEAFCHGCTMFRRKLSLSAEPDPLGVYFNVCRKCLDIQTEQPRMSAHSAEFNSLRMQHLISMQRQLEEELEREKNKALSLRRDSGKQAAVHNQAEQLAHGYEQHMGRIQDFVSGLKTPDWQKCKQWVPSHRVSHCSSCKSRMFARKIHCHICGQVFCRSCTPDEILLYIDQQTNEAKWAVNGYEKGTPRVRPDRFEVLRICKHCSGELKAILANGLSLNPATRTPLTFITSRATSPGVEDTFLTEIDELYEQLMALERDIEKWLPQYMRLVDSLDEDSTLQSFPDKKRMDLALMQSNLSNGMEQFALQSQKLNELSPTSRSETRLHNRVMCKMYQFYKENMHYFQASRKQLAGLFPVGDLDEFQSRTNLETMESVHAAVHQVHHEVLTLHERFRFNNSFFEHLEVLLSAIEDESKAILLQKQEDWDGYTRRIAEKTQSRTNAGQCYIVISDKIPLEQKHGVHYIVVSTCTFTLQELKRKLQARTSAMAYTRTKESLHEVFQMLERELSGHNADAHSP